MDHSKQTRVEFTKKLDISKDELIESIKNLYRQVGLPCRVDVKGNPSDKLTKVTVHSRGITSQDLLGYINNLDKKKESVQKKNGYFNPKAQNITIQARDFPTKVFQEGRVFYTDKRIDKEKIAREISARLPSISPSDIGFEGDENKIIYILSIGRIYEHEVIREVIDRHSCENKDFLPRVRIETKEQILDPLFLEKLEIKFPGYNFLAGGDFREFGTNKHIEILGNNPPLDEINKYISTLAAIPNMPQANNQQGVTKMSDSNNKVAAFDSFTLSIIKEATPKVTEIVSKNVTDVISPSLESLKGEIKKVSDSVSKSTLQEEIAKLQKDVSALRTELASSKSEITSLRKDIKSSEENIIKAIKSMKITFSEG